MTKPELSEKEIDKLVIAQADDDSAWDDAVFVELPVATTISLPPELAGKAAFFAQLHDMPTAEAWVQSIIQERIAFEESAFAGLKRVMEKRATYQP